MQSLRTGALCHPLKFGAKVAPQWRDKIILSLADSLGYRVHFLGQYEANEEEGDGEDGDDRLLGGGRGGKGRRHGEQGEQEQEQEQRRRRRGVNATAEEGEEFESHSHSPSSSSSVGPPPRGRQLLGGAAEAAAAAVVGADGSLVEAEGHKTKTEEEEEQPVLYWMPFYHITAARHELHPYNPWRQQYDCTHYCYTPLLWDPLVDGLHAALADRGFAGGK